MRRTFIGIACLGALLGAPSASLSAGPDAMWTSIEQSWRSHDAAGILAYAGSTVRVQINDQDPGNYSKAQAQAILQNYFAGVQTVSFAFRDKTQRVVTGDHRWQRGERSGSGTVTMIAEQTSDGWVLAEIYVRD